MAEQLKTSTDWLRARTLSPGVGVDRDKGIIRGVVLAQEGMFKSAGRGRFVRKSLDDIMRLALAAPNGLKSRLAHPTLSNDGIGSFLGRIRDPRLDTIGRRESEGQEKTNPVVAVRGDLHLDPSARNAPGKGDIADYVMTLAKSDPDALSTSLVLRTVKEFELDSKGKRVKDDKGEDLPPIWYPTQLHASDVVDTGDAVDGMLSADGMPDAIVRQAYALAADQFAGVDAETAANRLHTWVDRFVEEFYGLARLPIDPKTIRGIIRRRGRYTSR